ncbi:hypothetical protein LJC11_03825, partial [Bacteroidales bacterium OttesenSCG-928-I21]|nr:hypothetical protein [Bacteroidales bacterium OttesenSCG-928-I21]
MKPFFLKFLLLALPIICLSATKINNDPPTNYKRHWDKVTDFEKNNLQKSALKKVLEIYNLALAENNEEQIVKAIMHQLKYITELEEEGDIKAIAKLEEEILGYKGITKSFSHLILAELYKKYYSNKSHIIESYSVTTDFENNDIQTWDKTKFQDKIIKNIVAALDDELKNIDIFDYSEIITDAHDSKNDFPTLYDFVAYHSINTLTKQNYSYYRSSNLTSGNFKDTVYLNDAESFINLNIEEDSCSFLFTAAKIYQKWLNFRLQDKQNLEALLNVDTKRLQFIKTNSSVLKTEQAWINALSKLKEKHNSSPEVSIVIYELAKYYNNQGNSYNLNYPETYKYKSFKTKAISLLSEVLERFPTSKYVPYCENLKKEIEKQSFSFIVEKHVPSKEKIPVLISFKNTETLYISTIKCDYYDFKNIRTSIYDDEYIDIIKNISKSTVTKKINLPTTTDYNEHNTEYLIDALEYGFYVICIHAKPNLELDKNYLANSNVFVSDISINSNSQKNSEYYILNRISGKPIEAATVDLLKEEYNKTTKRYEYKKISEYKTDKTGVVNIKNLLENNYGSVRFDVKNGKDFISEIFYPIMGMQEKSKKTETVNFFTDRAIYRPGQTVYFKGIALISENDKTEINPNYSTTVDFLDVNYQKIGSTTVKSNKFGSFNGSFEIPLGVLTGVFYISCNEGNKYISVEEYKRPMFEVITHAIKNEYTINDYITVEAFAKTYAGTALTEGRVSYNITRSRLGRGFFMDIQDFDSGETEIDSNGKIQIKFKAEVNENEHYETFFYLYTININVTDINGETQNSSISINVPRVGFDISTNITDIILKEKFDSLTISATNSAGNLVETILNVEVFKLKNLQNVLVEKKWTKTDCPMYTQEQWYNEYSGHEYADETNFSNWEQEK